MNSEHNSHLITYRLSQAQTALDDAKYLLVGNRSPQSVINRCYYAMFYSTLALLQKIGTVPSKHTGAISLFDTDFVMKGIFPKQLSKDFHRAFELRQVSDYKVTDSLSDEIAKEMWNKAANFVGAVQKYLSEHP